MDHCDWGGWTAQMITVDEWFWKWIEIKWILKWLLLCKCFHQKTSRLDRDNQIMICNVRNPLWKHFLYAVVSIICLLHWNCCQFVIVILNWRELWNLNMEYMSLWLYIAYRRSLGFPNLGALSFMNLIAYIIYPSSMSFKVLNSSRRHQQNLRIHVLRTGMQ